LRRKAVLLLTTIPLRIALHVHLVRIYLRCIHCVVVPSLWVSRPLREASGARVKGGARDGVTKLDTKDGVWAYDLACGEPIGKPAGRTPRTKC
jgi:hypothetical protein